LSCFVFHLPNLLLTQNLVYPTLFSSVPPPAINNERSLSSASVMECLHGKAASYNLLEGIYANAIAQEVERLCVESCNGCQVGHLSQGHHDCLVMNENERWQMVWFTSDRTSEC
jgi:hypothetical protein